MRSKMRISSLFLLLLCAISNCFIVLAIELTFELPDNARQCFHEEISKATKCTVEFQVVTGGHYDVDMTLEGPNSQILYNGVKKQYDSFTWTTDQPGVYTVCFSNEFSTFSHKLVYMDFQVGDDDDDLPGINKQVTAMTQMETSSATIHENLNTVLDYQTHHRLREAQGRKRAEDLNERVFYWSVGETVVILFIGIGQVFVLKSLFSEKKSSISNSHMWEKKKRRAELFVRLQRRVCRNFQFVHLMLHWLFQEFTIQALKMPTNW